MRGREALGFQLQLNCYEHEVMITANVGTWERRCVCFVDAGLEALGVRMEFVVVQVTAVLSPPV